MRKLGPFEVSEIGLGCMNLSHAYGAPITREQGRAVLHKALDLGVDHFDSAALYGFGSNEELLGPCLKPHRNEIVLVSKCGMPRFQEPHFSANGQWLQDFQSAADDARCTPAQLALAWVLQRKDFIHVIPGTTSLEHLLENMGAKDVELCDGVCRKLEKLINEKTVSGGRYPVSTQSEIDTENKALIGQVSEV